MDFLCSQLKRLEGFDDLVKLLKNKNSCKAGVSGLIESQKSHYCYAVLKSVHKRAIYIAENELQANKAYEDFKLFYGDMAVILRPLEYILYDIEAKSLGNLYDRISVLERVINKDYEILIVSAEVLAQRMNNPDKIKKACFYFSLNNPMELNDIIRKLEYAGYERTESVSGKGQYAVRGGIVDFYPVNYSMPVRADFFGDELDSLRTFDTETQRSVEMIDEVNVIPAREILYDNAELFEIIERVTDSFNNQYKEQEENKDYDRSLLRSFKARINNDLDRFRNSGYFPGIDRYIPLVLKDYCTIAEYDEDAVIFMDEPAKILNRLETLNNEHNENCRNMLEKGLILNETSELYTAFYRFYNSVKLRKTVYLKTFGGFSDEGVNKNSSYTVSARQVTAVSNSVTPLLEQIKELKEQGKRIVFLAANKGRAERLREIFYEGGINAGVYEDGIDDIAEGQAAICVGALHRNFEYADIGLVVLSDSEFFTREGDKRKRRKSKKGKPINSFTDLSVGDYVVHEIHGIGQYMGMEQATVLGITRDYIKIKYSDNGFLYVPAGQMELVQKYIGAEGHSPRLSKLGGSEWTKAKKKVKESLKELAMELVSLYAKRQASSGFAYSKDTVWQTQFEEAFPFEETDDQLRCVEEIKKDMESERPMERLLCGDVGYGKTEVAMRAIFKAVMDGKQVAFLAPTTILAQQHFYTMKERFADFPIRVDYICRFRTASEQKEIKRKTKNGEIDILIGTHRLIQKDIEFKDLGLLVVDEEQRFGVLHKERLKTLKPNIDILSLSATPIPRTLHMSLIQIRDISIIEEPPEERFPVQTYVMEYNKELIRDAIYREMARKGQVFYLFNKVRTIDIKALELKELIPEARIAVAHGQMGERELEEIMMAFIGGDYDILVCTTIIESGLDMPNVNTIIVEDGDHLGLSQLYQIRGRVGRSNRMAYAYITYKKDKQLNEISEKRLQAIREFTEFGSGFKIAMRDLEIRGAGNLLGSQQHGQLESVGYDMYCKLLDKAVKEVRGELAEDESDEFQVDLQINAYIDGSYIASEEDRLEFYKKISLILNDEDACEIRDELIDRFGDVPEEIENLINIALLKALASGNGFTSVVEKNDSVIFKYGKMADIDVETVGRMIDKFKRKILFSAGAEPYITYKIDERSRKQLLKNLILLMKNN